MKRIVVIGGGPAGLSFAILAKAARPDLNLTVFERNRADDTSRASASSSATRRSTTSRKAIRSYTGRSTRRRCTGRTSALRCAARRSVAAETASRPRAQKRLLAGAAAARARAGRRRTLLRVRSTTTPRSRATPTWCSRSTDQLHGPRALRRGVRAAGRDVEGEVSSGSGRPNPRLPRRSCTSGTQRGGVFPACTPIRTTRRCTPSSSRPTRAPGVARGWTRPPTPSSIPSPATASRRHTARRSFEAQLGGHELGKLALGQLSHRAQARRHHENVVSVSATPPTPPTSRSVRARRWRWRTRSRRPGHAVGSRTQRSTTRLAAYEAARKPRVEQIQTASGPSITWWEEIRRYVDFPLERFAFHFMSRSVALTRDRIAARDPAFVGRVEDWFAHASAHAQPAPPADRCVAPDLDAEAPARRRRCDRGARRALASKAGWARSRARADRESRIRLASSPTRCATAAGCPRSSTRTRTTTTCARSYWRDGPTEGFRLGTPARGARCPPQRRASTPPALRRGRVRRRSGRASRPRSARRAAVRASRCSNRRRSWAAPRRAAAC